MNPNLKRIHLFYVENEKGVKDNIKLEDLADDERKKLESFFTLYKMPKTDPNKQRIALTIDDSPSEVYTILIVGPKRHADYHFSEKMFNAYHKLGYTVHYRCPEDLSSDQKYYNGSKRFKLSEIGIRSDMVIVDENHFLWDNDLNTPVIYHHREFKRPPTVNHPDVVLMWHQGLIDYWKTIFASEWMSKVPHHEVLNITVDIDKFKPKKKKYKGVIGISQREKDYPISQIKELANAADMLRLYQEYEDFKDLGYYWYEPTTDGEYFDFFPRCETLWIPLSVKQWISHRMLEAMACKTLCLIKLEDWEHEQALLKMGLENTVHYLGCESLEAFEKEYKRAPISNIINEAYNYVKNNLTDEHCAKWLIDLYHEKGFTSNRFDVICPAYWINDHFEDNLNNWFKELPIRKLFIGIGNKDIKIKIPKHPQIEVIDQRNIKTLGGCLKDLMDRVETKWFVFVHADVEISKHALKILECEMKHDVGIIESERLHWDDKMVKINNEWIPDMTYEKYHFRSRSFSGFQIIQKRAIQSLINKLEDDFLYRNEDMIFHSNCIENGFKYIKTMGMHIHQTKNTNWTQTWEKTHEMQWKGFVKYTNPNEITIFPCISAIKGMRDFGTTLSHCLFFCYRNNPNWGYEIRKAFLQWEQEEGKLIKS